tara:strand:+ start:15221 stop:16444 length:1224 start_codon:yes stop_codon:yes gene_type:complete
MTAGSGTVTGTAQNKKDFQDEAIFGGNNDPNGKYLKFTNGSNDGRWARVHDYIAGTALGTAGTSYRVIVRPDVTGANFAVGDTYEMWERHFNPTDIEGFINQAIIDVTGQVYDPEEDISLKGDGNITRFAIPTALDMINRVDYRASVSFTKIDLAEVAWTAGSNVTASVDSKDKKQGTNSAKLVLAAGVSAGDVIAYEDFTAINLSEHTHVEFWIKCTIATIAADLKLLLDNTSGAVSPLETLSLPALVADTWTFVRLALANPETDTAIISVGLEDDTDIGAATVWIDDIRAVTDATEVWGTLPRHLWRIDHEARTLVMTNGGRITVGERLIKLVGGGKPVLLEADATVSEIDDWYVISRATELAFLAAASSPNQDTQAMLQKAQFWAGEAERAKSSFPVLVNARVV